MLFLKWRLNVCVVLFMTLSTALQPSGVELANKNALGVVPGGYIVEFENARNARVPDFYSNVSRSNIDVTPRMTLAHSLFQGASFVVTPEQDSQATVDIIQSFTSVKKIWPIHLFSRPVMNTTTPSFLSEVSAARLRKRDVTDNYAVHAMGGVDKLHTEGYTGEGIFIGIVDTGVDYNHPSLGGGFGPGFKVAHGYDLVGDAYTGDNIPIPDPDPMDCAGHGTHVSGIVGAYPDTMGFSGVAPNATLGMWKVFGCDGNVSVDVLISAFNMAHEAGVDVISSSIGGINGWTENAWDVATQRIVEAGTPCVISAGNSGQYAIFETSGAADAIGAMAVGSVDSMTATQFVAEAEFVVNGESSTFGYLPSNTNGDFGTVSFPLYAITLDTTIVGDACSTLPSDTPDLSPYVVLIRRGPSGDNGCPFDLKLANVAAFGAKRVLFYNNVADLLVNPGTTSLTAPSSGIVSAEQGAEWIAYLKAGVSVTIKMTALAQTLTTTITPPNGISGGKMSYYSTWGPTYEMHVKPEISAPGGNILSTFPLAYGGYAIESGTSMAAPYMAGVVALIKQIRGNISPAEISQLIATTARPILWNDGSSTSDFLAPVLQQGSGMVNAYAAAHAITTVDIPLIALNDTAHFTAKHSFTITNTGPKAVTYKLSNQGAGTAYTFRADNDVLPIPQPFPPDFDLTYAAIRFEPSTSITVPAKSSAVIDAHFTRPQGLAEYRIPMYSGYIAINGSNSESLTLPYAGAVGKLKDVPLWNGAWGAFLTDTTFQDVVANTIFRIPGPNSTYVAEKYPRITIVLAMGSPLMRVEIVPKNTKNLPRILGKQAIGTMPGFPMEYNPRQQLLELPWDGTLTTGEFVPAGEYKFLFRALRLFGDPTYHHDYDVWESIYFKIEYVD